MYNFDLLDLICEICNPLNDIHFWVEITFIENISSKLYTFNLLQEYTWFLTTNLNKLKP